MGSITRVSMSDQYFADAMHEEQTSTVDVWHIVTLPTFSSVGWYDMFITNTLMIRGQKMNVIA